MSHMMCFAVLLALSASGAQASGSHNHGTSHGSCCAGYNFEWAGIFNTSNQILMWTAQKVKGKYADATMNFAAIPANVATEAELLRLKGEGNHSMGMTCTHMNSWGIITPEDDKCFQLNFDQNMWQSIFKINANAHGAVAIFAQHFPTEFEATAHYLKDNIGTNVEPAAQLPEPAATATAAPTSTSNNDKPWGATMAAAAIINVVTLIGVILVVPISKRFIDNYELQFVAIISGFAAGAIIACAFFLLLFEATHLIAEGWSKEVDVLWRWGTMVLAGYLLPGFIDGAASLAMMKKKDTPAAQDSTGKEGDQIVEKNSTPARVRVISGVLLGDFFHNLCDGFFLGAAFKGCGNSFGWGVALSTVLHELPQELADYTILTGPMCGMGPIMALATNFVSGLSVVFGAIIILATDVSNQDNGLLLAFGGGVYIHIAATECMPRIYNEKLSVLIRVCCIVAFIVGAVMIGLILLDHEHCVPNSGSASTAAASSGGGGHHHR